MENYKEIEYRDFEEFIEKNPELEDCTMGELETYHGIQIIESEGKAFIARRI